jgi:hypothetical protein
MQNAECGTKPIPHSAFSFYDIRAGVMRVQFGEKYSTGSDSDQAIPIAPSAQTPSRYHSLCCT